jgi:hypothetical protein
MKAKVVGWLLIGAAVIGTAGMVGGSGQKGLVVHEWGTFTSLQGSDGVPVRWNPLVSSQLPRFVYNWNNAGLGRYAAGLLSLGQKSVLMTLQRMETPVIYFYADQELTADLTVRFPQGGITEWYPQAPRIGPCVTRPSPIVTTLDSGLHRAGVSPKFSLDSIFDGGTVKESLIHWQGLKILPAAGHADLSKRLLNDASGSHYFAARDTDSAFVQADSLSSTNLQPELEKFLFYRGVGNFTTPLSVQMDAGGTITIGNNGKEPLKHLLILSVHGITGNCSSMEQLKSGQQKAFNLEALHQTLPMEELRSQVRAAMITGLRAEGLYAREALAMVNTWDDSWFQEEGVRVLYILPRAWTDQILPMQMDPTPKELVRVMVGRAELVTPDTEFRLTLELTRAQKGEVGADQEIRAIIRSLGRFAQPVFQQALARTDTSPAQRDKLLALLYEGQQ